MDIAARLTNHLPNRKHQTSELTSEFYQRFKGKIIAISFDILQKTETERLLLIHSDASITLVLKSDRRQYKKTTDQYFHEYRCKNLQQNTSKPNPATYKKDYTP